MQAKIPPRRAEMDREKSKNVVDLIRDLLSPSNTSTSERE